MVVGWAVWIYCNMAEYFQAADELRLLFLWNIRQWARSGHLVIVEATRHRLPNLLLWLQRQWDVYNVIHDDDTLTASAVTGIGQTVSPLAEVEEETDVFLKTVAETL